MRAGPPLPLLNRANLLVLPVVAVLWLLWPGFVRAQPAGGAMPASNQVDVQFLDVGVGGHIRPGEWTGFRIQATDRALAAREVIIRLTIADADGDPAQYQRIVTLNPGVKQSLWLYGRLPFAAVPQFPIRVEVLEVRDGGDGTAPARGGDILGVGVFRLQQVVSPTVELLGVVGRPRVGLDYYKERWQGADFAPTGHEATALADQLRVPNLPDRWMGLAPFSTLVWSGSGAGEDPTDLSESQASALREWVERGGHLIVVLPSAGQLWINPANPLAEVMPRVTVERLDGVPLEPYRPMLTAGKQPLPDKSIVHVLEPRQDAKPGEALRVLVGVDGRSVATRRLIGTGAVTVIGLDLASRTLMGVNGVQADVFWHRVLGRRGMLYSQEQLALMSRPRSNTDSIDRFDMRDPRYFDADLAALVNKKGRSAVGVLLALVVFAAYWLAAGPLGFAVLKRRKWTHHAWVSFVVAGAAFTAVAWGGAGLLRPRRVEGQHVTIIDHVYGQPVQRARTWVGMLLPRYGSMTVSVPAESGERYHNAIASWDAPGDNAGGGATFADAAPYAVDASRPDSATYPARSTVKTLQIDWAGGPRWKMPLPSAVAGGSDAGASAPLRLAAETDPRTRITRWVVRGTLTHQMPMPLADVEVIVVREQRPLTDGATRNLLFMGESFRLVDKWEAGKALDLAAVTGGDRAGSALALRMDSIREGSVEMPGRQQDLRISNDAFRRLSDLAFFRLLPPPDTRTLGSSPPVLARRRATHGLDLSRWMTQPCVIIQGWLGDQNTPGDCPVPVMVDGEPAEMTGRTLVRWIYPLGEAPPRIERGEAPQPDPKP